jgi:hypothetical protein
MRRVALLLVLAVTAFAAYALTARFLLHGPVDRASLWRGVAAASGSASALPGFDDGGCVRKGPRTYDCSVSDPEGSGGGTYRVTVRPGSSCWTARHLGGHGAEERRLPDAVDGCVRRWEWSLADLVL